MSDKIKLWFFIFSIPILLAIGHDLYVNFYQNDDNRAKLEALQIDQLATSPTGYMASDFGYILVQYIPNVYDDLKSGVDDTTWRAWVDPILGLYTFIVASVPFIIFSLWVLVWQLFQSWPFVPSAKSARIRGDRGSAKDDPLDKRSKQQKFQYKRK